jgi:2,3-dihydroxybiphenyl 1,2-dioxygenase
MEHALEIAYLELEIADPELLTPFFGEVIGLLPGEPLPGVDTTWRNDDRAYRVAVRPGPANDAVAVGFEAIDAAAYERTLERLGAAGFAATERDADEARAARVERIARTTAPWGVAVDLVLGLERASTPFDSPAMPGGFLTEGVGFGHVVFATTAFDESCRFLVDGLGMTRSDWLEMQIMEGISLEVWFFHCNARHHTVALAKAPFDLPQRLHHVMFETRERDDVGAAFDRVWATELAIPNGLGRHDNDGMFSFYVQSPAGFQVEVGHGARTITEGWDDDRRYERISAWGHQPLRQP